MDIALELCDKYIFDHIYTALLPAQQKSYNLDNGAVNASSFNGSSAWTYEPATSFLSFPPTEAAYTSQWARDNVYRQMISLFFITWFAPPCLVP